MDEIQDQLNGKGVIVDVEDLARRIASILEAQFSAPESAVTFMEAARAFTKAGGSSRFLGDETTGVCGALGSLKLSDISQATVDEAALSLYPDVLPKTRLRQFYAPFRAV